MCYIPKLLDVYQWGKYATIYATYKLIGIYHVIRSIVHRQHKIATVMQDDNTTAQLYILSWPLGQISQERDTVPLWLYKKVLAVLLSKYKATTFPDKWKAILHSISIIAYSSCKTIWAL